MTIEFNNLLFFIGKCSLTSLDSKLPEAYIAVNLNERKKKLKEGKEEGKKRKSYSEVWNLPQQCIVGYKYIT